MPFRRPSLPSKQKYGSFPSFCACRLLERPESSGQEVGAMARWRSARIASALICASKPGSTSSRWHGRFWILSANGSRESPPPCLDFWGSWQFLRRLSRPGIVIFNFVCFPSRTPFARPRGAPAAQPCAHPNRQSGYHGRRHTAAPDIFGTFFFGWALSPDSFLMWGGIKAGSMSTPRGINFPSKGNFINFMGEELSFPRGSIND